MRRYTRRFAQVETFHKLLNLLYFPDFAISFGHHLTREKSLCHLIQKARFPGPIPYALSTCCLRRASKNSATSSLVAWRVFWPRSPALYLPKPETVSWTYRPERAVVVAGNESASEE